MNGWLSAIAAVTLWTSLGSRGGTELPDPAPFDRILEVCVKSEGVDYLALRFDHLAALDAWLAEFAKVEFDALSPAERLAAGVDLYNATVMRAIAARFRAGYSVAEKDFALFKEKLIHLQGKALSLDELEHGILRKLGEPSIHAALVCGARSCPPLLASSYSSAEGTQRMRRRMVEFLRDPGRNTIDREAHKLRLSRVFEWFADDFGGPARLPGYVADSLGEDVASYAIEFRDYDWSLNLARIGGDRWVEVVAESLEVSRVDVAQPDAGAKERLAKGDVLERIRTNADDGTTEIRVRRHDGALFQIEARHVRVFHNS